MIPDLLIQELDTAKVGYTIQKGAIYYLSVEDYLTSQKVIKTIEKRLPQLGFNKYNNKRVKLMVAVLDRSQFVEATEPVTFDSEDEAERFFHHLDRYVAGEVKRVINHPRIELIPSFLKDGGKKLAVVYTPDFLIEYENGDLEFEDVKGMSTEAGDLRRKLYDYLSTQQMFRYFGVPLRWISYSKKHGDKDGWISYDRLLEIRAKARKEKKAG